MLPPPPPTSLRLRHASLASRLPSQAVFVRLMALASALRWKVAAPTEPHASSQDRPNPPKMAVQVVLAESALALLMLVAPQLHPSVEVRWREVIPNLLAYLKVRISLP